MKLQHIYCPTDFSETSVNALRFAAELAKANNAQLHLVHVYNKPYYTTAYNGAISAAVDKERHLEIREAILQDLHQLAKLDFLQGLQVSAKLITDKASWKFYEDLDENVADLIVMGTHGMTGLIHGGLVGTNTDRVIRFAPFPVLSVPAEARFAGINTILFPTGFTEGSVEVFGHVVNFASLFDARIEVAYINEDEDFDATQRATEAFNQLKAAVPYEKLNLVVHDEDSVTEGIRGLATKHNVDVIAMHTHGRTGFSHFLRGSITEDVSATVKTPVMAFKAGL